MTEDLVKKAGRGVGWNISAQMVQQAIKFLVIIILTRLLEPRDFGIFAMVTVFTEFIRPFREWGFQAALIQKKDINEDDQNTAFWAIGGVGALIYLFSCASASFVGHFFNLPEVGQIIPVIALIFLVSPFGSVQWALLTRELNFSTIAIIDTVAMLFYGISACWLAYRGWGVWSFVWASLLREFIWSLIAWFIRDWRPMFRFSIGKLRELLSFAANCMGTGVLNYGINNFDNLMVGKFLGAIPLGFYNLAFNTISQPEMRIVSQITSVVFPVYSMIKGDRERIQQAYFKTVKMIALITVPLVSVLFVATKDFVLVFYGAKWLPAVLPIRIMCLYGLVKALAAIASPVFLSQGRPDIEFRLTMFRLVAFVGFIFFGIRYGIVGVASAVLAYAVVNFFPTFYFSNRLLGIGQYKFYAAILKYVFLSFVVILVLWMVNLFCQKHGLDNALLRLIFYSAAGFFSYFIILRIFLKADYDVLKNLIKRVVS